MDGRKYDVMFEKYEALECIDQYKLDRMVDSLEKKIDFGCHASQEERRDMCLEILYSLGTFLNGVTK